MQHLSQPEFAELARRVANNIFVPLYFLSLSLLFSKGKEDDSPFTTRSGEPGSGDDRIHGPAGPGAGGTFEELP
jgi:hypothetical protein